jgi:hypothetical protein
MGYGPIALPLRHEAVILDVPLFLSYNFICIVILFSVVWVSGFWPLLCVWDNATCNQASTIRNRVRDRQPARLHDRSSDIPSICGSRKLLMLASESDV